MNTESNNDEAARLEVLRQYQILDTEPEEAYDNLEELINIGTQTFLPKPYTVNKLLLSLQQILK